MQEGKNLEKRLKILLLKRPMAYKEWDYNPDEHTNNRNYHT